MEDDLVLLAEDRQESADHETISGHWCRIRSLVGVTLLALLGVVALHSQGSAVAKVQQTHSSLRSAIQKDDADLCKAKSSCSRRLAEWHGWSEWNSWNQWNEWADQPKPAPKPKPSSVPLPIPRPTGWKGFVVPVAPVVRVVISIKITVAIQATQFTTQMSKVFRKIFASFGAKPGFRLRFSGAFSSLAALTGRRLGDKVLPGSEGGVEAEVNDAPSDLLKAAQSGDLVDKATRETESTVDGSEVSDVDASATDDSHPAGDYDTKGWGTVCRGDENDMSTDNYGKVEVLPGQKTVLECSEECNSRGDACHAFEYRKSAGRCEIHVAPVCHVAKQNPVWFAPTPDDFQCYIGCR